MTGQEGTGEVKVEEQEVKITVEEPDQAAIEMMRQMYEGMKIGIAIEVEGSIVETDATYRNGSTVTLVDFDFGELLKDEEKFKKLVPKLAVSMQTLEQTKELLKDVPGIKMELKDSLKIRFK